MPSLWEHQQQQRRQLLEWGRQDPLRARKLLQQQRRAEMEKQQQRGVQQLSFLLPQKAIDFPRLFGFTDVLLLPFDLEGDPHKAAAAGDTAAAAGAGAGTAAGGESPAATGGMGGSSSLDLSNSFCSGEWLYVGGEPLLHASEAQELQQLLSGFTGISPVFVAPVDPHTNENVLYTGKHYSLAFLIEAAIKDNIRQVPAAYHTPWDEEVTLISPRGPPPRGPPPPPPPGPLGAPLVDIYLGCCSNRHLSHLQVLGGHHPYLC